LHSPPFRAARPDRVRGPEIGGKRAELLGHLDGAARIVDGRDDLAAVTDDALVGHQPLDVGLVKAGDLVEIKPGEGGTEILALAQDREPGQARLEAFEADLFEQRMSSVTGRPHS
jgi:hypothetical protein